MRNKRDTRDYITRLCEREYDRQMREARDARWLAAHRRAVPFIGGPYEIRKHDEHMATVRRALAAVAWHASTGPSWAQPLSLREEEIESEVHHECPGVQLCGYFSLSVRLNDFDFERHPTFPVFASGVMAYTFAPPEILMHKELQRLYPPQKLEGLKCSPLRWRPPAT